MELQTFDHPQEFYDRSQDYLSQDEGRHNLLLGICQQLLQTPQPSSAAPYLAIVTSPPDVLAVALQTPPYPLVLSQMADPAAIAAIVQDLQHQHRLIPGVSATPAVAQAFVQQWQTATGQSAHLAMDMTLHQLDQVQPIAPVSGHLRVAEDTDYRLLCDWYQAFGAEVGDAIRTNATVAERWIKTNLQQQHLYVWTDPAPVSFVCGVAFSDRSARLGPVYTPPADRRQGYASACVAALSQQFLDRGCQACYLFTDRANPTSNKIYRAIGYIPIESWHLYQFTP